MSKRLAFLEKMTSEGSKDPLAWYGLALEYANLGRVDDALATFARLRGMNADYVPMYLMCGQVLAKAGRGAEARAWLEEGVVRARAQGNTHALGEMQDALAALG
ncbi:MAG TPA: tetratricopeptide repeat protein [Minicystis sp.]|nr:tetratricopeptide repeat protein [Minicystis sp.]